MCPWPFSCAAHFGHPRNEFHTVKFTRNPQPVDNIIHRLLISSVSRVR